ncbi:MAG TPA: oligosaccharide flippase family protein [Gemmatimonadales bacterium]|nr:oligosaccharide flippase family protein [Gemmatimonadales bacterium]
MSSPGALSAAAPPAAHPGGLLRKVAGYTVMRASAEALLGLRGILLAALLGPEAFGSWALLRLATRYAALAGLGVFRGLEVELVQASDDGTSRSRASGAALGFVLVVSGALAAAALVAGALVESPAHRLILQGFAAAVVAEAVYGYALVLTRIGSTLRRYALLEAGTGALHLMLGVALARVFGLAGAFAALALSSVVGAGVATRWVEMRLRLDAPSVRGMLAAGLPVALTGMVGTLLQTADRWVVAAWGGHELLGYYAFGAALASAGAALALSVRTVVFPEVYGDAKLAGAPAALQRHLERSLLPFATLVPPVLGAIGAGVGPALALVAPQYAAAVAPARLFLLSGAAMGLASLASVGAVAARRQTLLPAYAMTALAVNFGLATLALAAGLGLEGAAAASLAGYVVFAAAVLRLNARLSGILQPEGLVVRALRPLVWCAVAASVAGHAAIAVRAEAGAIVIYLLLVAPLLPRCRGEWRRLKGGR